MSTELIVVVVAVWVAIGLAATTVMVRRGGDLYTWASLGILFGPVATIMAVVEVRAERRVPPHVLRPGRPGRGWLDVLVGIDGSPEAEAAIAWVLALHGPSIRRLAYGVVVPFGTAPEALASGSPVPAALDRALKLADGCDASTVILEGAPAEALVRYAEQEGYDLLAVGTRGDPGPAASLAVALAASTPMPVLLASEPPGSGWRSGRRRGRRRPGALPSGPVEGDVRLSGRSADSARMETSGHAA
jgi:nucleotide-binding universal stress UspA family protein